MAYLLTVYYLFILQYIVLESVFGLRVIKCIVSFKKLISGTLSLPFQFLNMAGPPRVTHQNPTPPPSFYTKGTLDLRQSPLHWNPLESKAQWERHRPLNLLEVPRHALEVLPQPLNQSSQRNENWP